MDTKLIKQFGDDILCYRIQSKRTKKRKRHNDFEKRILQKSREQDALYEQKRNLGWEPVHPPYQKGWERYFILRADVSTGKKADFFQNILNKINTAQYSWKNEFTVKRKKYGKKIFVPKPQHLQTFRDWELRKLNLSPDELQFFRADLITGKYGKEHLLYVFTEPWRFQLTVQPNMIDKRKKLDTELEAEIDILHRYMLMKHLYPYLAGLEKGRFRYKEWKVIPKAKYTPFLQKHSVAGWLSTIQDELI